MPRYYLELASDGEGGQPRILAVCVQELEGPTGRRPAQVLARWEWGERELVKALLDRGALEPSGRFEALGPHVREDLLLLLGRAERLRVAKPDRAEIERVWSSNSLPVEAPALPPSWVSELHQSRRYREAVEELLRRAEAVVAAVPTK